jgi:acetolactate synthase-1/2/3 large subunit
VDAPLSFTDIAEGMGVDATTAESPAAIKNALTEALDTDGPTLIAVPTDPTEPQASEWMGAER